MSETKSITPIDSARHTPGPWTLREDIGVVFGADDKPVMTAGGGCITERADEYLANARLIAAAPQLLAALKNLRNRECFCGLGIGNPMYFTHTANCAAAMEAVAKAEGREMAAR